jgi:hypothetical protein
MAETIMIFFALPAIAIGLCVLAVLLRYVPHVVIEWFPESPLLAEVTAALVLVGIGRVLFGWRLGHYMRDPTAAAEFDSEDDQRIVFWQKFVLVILYMIVIPCSSLLIMRLV